MADTLTKSLPRPALSKHRQYMWGTRIPFQLFISLSRLDGPRRRPTISSRHADTNSHAPPEKYILGVCTCVYVCVVCRYIDKRKRGRRKRKEEEGGERKRKEEEGGERKKEEKFDNHVLFPFSFPPLLFPPPTPPSPFGFLKKENLVS